MPSRILRDGILSSEPVASIGWAEEVLYRRLMSVVDDYGRFYASSKLIRAACYPLQIDKVSDADIEKWLTKCVTAALVSVYPAPDGKRYLQIEKFGQQLRAKSKFPEPMAGNGEQLKSVASNCEQPLTNAHLVVSVFEDVIVSEGVVDKSKCAEAPNDETVTAVIVDGLNVEAWTRWIDYRKQIRKPIKPASVLAAQNQLAGFGSDQSAVVEQSIAAGYTGLFELKSGKGPPRKVPQTENFDNVDYGEVRLL